MKVGQLRLVQKKKAPKFAQPSKYLRKNLGKDHRYVRGKSYIGFSPAARLEWFGTG
jgi:hypothetical protein